MGEKKAYFWRRGFLYSGVIEMILDHFQEALVLSAAVVLKEMIVVDIFRWLYYITQCSLGPTPVLHQTFTRREVSQDFANVE